MPILSMSLKRCQEDFCQLAKITKYLKITGENGA
jgi:hypothetical protein